jgi:hypothetical protein
VRPARRRGDREKEVVELNSKVPVRDERKKSKKLEVNVWSWFPLRGYAKKKLDLVSSIANKPLQR